MPLSPEHPDLYPGEIPERDRFQYEHLCALIVREAKASHHSVGELLELLRLELLENEGGYR